MIFSQQYDWTRAALDFAVLPKNFDPTGTPDPERWLPMRERTYYRGKRKNKKRGDVGKLNIRRDNDDKYSELILGQICGLDCDGDCYSDDNKNNTVVYIIIFVYYKL